MIARRFDVWRAPPRLLEELCSRLVRCDAKVVVSCSSSRLDIQPRHGPTSLGLLVCESSLPNKTFPFVDVGSKDRAKANFKRVVHCLYPGTLLIAYAPGPVHQEPTLSYQSTAIVSFSCSILGVEA